MDLYHAWRDVKSAWLKKYLKNHLIKLQRSSLAIDNRKANLLSFSILTPDREWSGRFIETSFLRQGHNLANRWSIKNFAPENRTSFVFFPPLITFSSKAVRYGRVVWGSLELTVTGREKKNTRAIIKDVFTSKQGGEEKEREPTVSSSD